MDSNYVLKNKKNFNFLQINVGNIEKIKIPDNFNFNIYKRIYHNNNYFFNFFFYDLDKKKYLSLNIINYFNDIQKYISTRYNLNTDKYICEPEKINNSFNYSYLWCNDDDDENNLYYISNFCY